MNFKTQKRYLTITKDEINSYIEYVMIARNELIDMERPIEEVNTILEKLLKIKRKLRA